MSYESCNGIPRGCCVPLISLLSPQLLLFISHEPTLLQQHHIFIPSKRQKCTTANQWQQHWRWNQPRWYLLKEFSLCQISTGCPASGFFAESMPRENKIMLLISPGSSSFLLPSASLLSISKGRWHVIRSATILYIITHHKSSGLLLSLRVVEEQTFVEYMITRFHHGVIRYSTRGLRGFLA